jgi:hypothetical protein
MLTGVAVMVEGPSHNFTGASVFVVVFLALIVMIFVRVYGKRGRSGPRTTHRSKRRTVHQTVDRSGPRTPHDPSRAPEPGGKHAHGAASQRRPNQP